LHVLAQCPKLCATQLGDIATLKNNPAGRRFDEL
jgi:hypothetical protein